ncbi:hypothetical protein C0J52_15080 [Blattella germanica]|nr:hypothetical protein C0J52_15080 [Blattella germanica]
MDMLDMPVTLIVKAPNQQVEDQTIHCELNWTIRKLKGYLSEVYPSKPRTEDQKLIYSGQLLHDSVTLKDVLRRYEGQETHTVHLVCTPRDPRHFNSVVTKTLTRMKTHTPLETRSAETSQASPETVVQSHLVRVSSETAVKMPNDDNLNSEESDVQGLPLEPKSLNDLNHLPDRFKTIIREAPSDGLRHRLSASQPTSQPSNTMNIPYQAPDPRAFWAGAMSSPYASTSRYDPNNMSQQMAWMQQAYAHYVTQYMQMYQLGFFRAQQIQAARIVGENNNEAVDARVVENNNVQNQNEGVGAAGVGAGAERPAREEGSGVEAPDPEPDRPSLFALTWTFFTSFFASLIPEQPGAL